MSSNTPLPTIRTDDLTPGGVTEQQSQVTPAVPPSSPSIPRLPSQNFDSPSLDISISALLAASNASEPEIAEKATKVMQLSQEKSELDKRLREIEQRLKAVEEAEKKRGAGTTA
ncbi:hypothetical protein RhiJN_28763 [Ceratobasidium sp. AG-Ba]|nr:hypothetical protein RhiJN_14707 [Ceratobasidium sp. AG-Ba]QRW00745.1 hypothetical protein RhiJN_28763 [Ceratobasidium sp. AG-Ba]QRW15246.1 hypothetical protein RhiLY_14245 [Ceratobasidium sp. AG-Ba]